MDIPNMPGKKPMRITPTHDRLNAFKIQVVITWNVRKKDINFSDVPARTDPSVTAICKTVVHPHENYLI